MMRRPSPAYTNGSSCIESTNCPAAINDRAHDDRHPQAEEAVGHEAAEERREVDEAGVPLHHARGFARLPPVVLHEEEHQHGAHAVVAEALPHLGEEERVEALGVALGRRIGRDALRVRVLPGGLFSRGGCAHRSIVSAPTRGVASGARERTCGKTPCQAWFGHPRRPRGDPRALAVRLPGGARAQDGRLLELRPELLHRERAHRHPRLDLVRGRARGRRPHRRGARLAAGQRGDAPGRAGDGRAGQRLPDGGCALPLVGVARGRGLWMAHRDDEPGRADRDDRRHRLRLRRHLHAGHRPRRGVEAPALHGARSPARRPQCAFGAAHRLAQRLLGDGAHRRGDRPGRPSLRVRARAACAISSSRRDPEHRRRPS